MNRYVFLHRIKGPVMILVFGITALLDQWGVLNFGQSWPLYLIVLGVLMLAERAAWMQAQSEMPPPAGYAGTQPQNYPGQYPPQYPNQRGGWNETSASTTALTTAPPDLPRGTDREER